MPAIPEVGRLKQSEHQNQSLTAATKIPCPERAKNRTYSKIMVLNFGETINSLELELQMVRSHLISAVGTVPGASEVQCNMKAGLFVEGFCSIQFSIAGQAPKEII